MRRLERGASYVPLIIVIVLLIAALVWAWDRTSTAEDLLRKNTEIQLEINQLREQASETALRHKKIMEAVGFGKDDGTLEVEPDKVVASTGKHVTDMKSKFVLKVPVSVYNVADDGGLVREQTEETYTLEYVAQGSLPSEVTLELLYGYMNSSMGRMLYDIERLVAKLEAQMQNMKAQKETLDASIADKDAQINDLTGQLNTAQTQAAEEQQRLKSEAEDAEDKRREAVEELATKEREFTDKVAQKDNEILGLTQQVRKLMAREKPKVLQPGPDGQVLAASAGAGIVVLDRGKKDRMMPGLTFQVYNFGKGGQKIDKGIVHVLDVMDTTCKAKIVEVFSPMRPITTGDLIESPVYDRDEAVHMYLLGTFRKYGKSDAKARLESLGVLPDEKVTIDTNYLVIGTPTTEDENLRETEAYKRAQELGIAVITEAQLSMFLRY